MHSQVREEFPAFPVAVSFGICFYFIPECLFLVVCFIAYRDTGSKDEPGRLEEIINTFAIAFFEHSRATRFFFNILYDILRKYTDKILLWGLEIKVLGEIPNDRQFFLAIG
jgi:hypothetical protein